MKNKKNMLPFQGVESQEIAATVQNSTGFSLKRAIAKRVYAWHRIIGLITIIPVIFWTLSGFMHPFMAHWFKPRIAKEFIIPQPLDQAQIKLPIQSVLQQNSISTFKNFRLVSVDGSTFYQVKKISGDLAYFNAQDGKVLKNGDRIYAEQLARYCIADQKSKVTSATVVKDFNQQYKFVNRLLPVWKISFDRPDGMDVYIETGSSRLGTFNNHARKVFLWVFDTFHNWSFLDAIASNTLRIAIMMVLLSIIILSALSGLVIYGLFWKRFKKPSVETPKSLLRRYHRQIGIATAFVTLTFAASGLYHATRKLEPNRLPEMVYAPNIDAAELSLSPFSLDLDWARLLNLSLVRMKNEVFYQVFYGKTASTPPKTVYLNTRTGMELADGNIVYAKQLANQFYQWLQNTETAPPECCQIESPEEPTMLADAKLLESRVLSKFESREYGFVFKRLPVVRLAYDTPAKDAYFIETASSRLAAHVSNGDRIEGYSFAIFHKFLFLDWAGKDVRDLFTIFSALGVLIVSLFGLAVFLRK